MKKIKDFMAAHPGIVFVSSIVLVLLGGIISLDLMRYTLDNTDYSYHFGRTWYGLIMAAVGLVGLLWYITKNNAGDSDYPTRYNRL